MKVKTNTTWSSLVALFSVHELSFEEARKRLLFGTVCLTSSFVITVFGAYHIAVGDLVEGILNVSGGMILIGSLLLARLSINAQAYYRVPALVAGVLFIYFATLGESNGYRMLWLYAYPPLVLFLIGHREGLIYIGIVTLVWTAALLVPSPISGPEVYDPAMTLRFLTSFGLVVATSWFLEAVRNFYASSMHAHNTNLEYNRRQMHDLAYSDDLTELPNRRSALLMMDDTLGAMKVDESKSALIGVLDIDRFKVINDHFGHQVGDQVLRSVARRVRNAIRTNDFVGRYGGEEFLLVIPDAAPDQYLTILEKVRWAVCQRPISVEGILHHVTVSIGATTATSELRRGAVIEQADQALYTAKQTGRNRCVMYEEGLDSGEDTISLVS